MTAWSPPPAEVLQAYGLPGARVAPLGSGLINQTWLVEADGRQTVLQALNPLFPPTVNDDIRAVTAHLRRQGCLTPELLPSRDGAWWVEAGGRVYRLMTHIAGVSLERLDAPSRAWQAGALLARFHRALDGLDHVFASQRLGVHDTPRHLANLRRALAEHEGHPRLDQIRPLADEILSLAGELPDLPALPPRLVHGDPKLNNLLFDPATGAGLCLIDLDTLGPMPLALELGDALRSWCNPAGEDQARAAFSLELFGGAVAGYAAGASDWISPAERGAIVTATLTIYVELAARFCADALNESYFGWSPERFPSRSIHNQVRAQSQLAAARSLLAQQAEADQLLARAFQSA